MGGDEYDPVCVLYSRGYLKWLVLSQLVGDLREGLLGFIEPLIDSIDHSSEGGGSLTPEAAPGARACYELGQKSHRNADFTVDLVPSRSLFPAFLSRF